jgi:hypothetical protein
MFTLLALAVSLGAAGWAIANEADGERVHKIEIESRVHCESEDLHSNLEGLGGGHFMKMMHGAHKGGFLGVGLTDLTPELRVHFGVPEGVGVMVSKVVDDSPAQKSGLQVGDIIALVDGAEIASGGALAAAIGGHEDGESVTLEVWRDGNVEQINATVGEREGMRMAFMPRRHMRLGGDGEHAMQRRIVIQCDDDTDDRAVKMGHLGDDFDFDCGADECEVRVECEEDGCTCTVNGEETDCAGIPGVPGH